MTKSIQSSLANEPCLDYSTAAVLMRVCRAAHAVVSAAEVHFHVSKEALYIRILLFLPSPPFLSTPEPVGVYTICFLSGRRPLSGWLRRPAAILERLTLARTPLHEVRTFASESGTSGCGSPTHFLRSLGVRLLLDACSRAVWSGAAGGKQQKHIMSFFWPSRCLGHMSDPREGPRAS